MSVGRESSSASERPMLLETAGLTKRFGGVTAVNAVDLAVDERTTLGLIGPNGAGKTTLINLISGVLTADEGAIRFAGADISREPAHPRRACRRHEPDGVVGAAVAHALARHGRTHDHPHRARRATRHGSVRSRRRAELRSQDRGRLARRDPA